MPQPKHCIIAHSRPRAKWSVYPLSAGRVPLSSRLTQEGLIVGRETANLTVKRWLPEVANARVHGTTGAILAERWVSERLQLPHCQINGDKRESRDRVAPLAGCLGSEDPQRGA
jgi:hypothetical protein